MLPSTHFRILAISAPLALIAMTACGDSGSAKTTDSLATAAPTVAAVPVAVADIGTSEGLSPVIAVGTYASRDEIPLGFKIGGVVQRVLVDEGATVQRGQILAVLDLREIDASVTKAQAMVDKATRDHARLTRLVADSVATSVQLQDASTALDAARADLATARVNREFATITAPEAGTVLQRMGTPGATVAAGSPMFMLGGSRRGRVLRAGLPDRDALKVQAGDSATVTFDAVPQKKFGARVVLVGRSADPRTGTYSVELSLRDADALPSGLVGQAQVHVRAAAGTKNTAVSTLPADALLEADGDSASVYLVRSDATAPGKLVAERLRVEVAGIEGDRVRVRGVPAEARVVTRGAPYVTPGAPVRIVTRATLDSVSQRRVAGTETRSTQISSVTPRGPVP
ncbi:MAG: efflux RND transporter periplasmic adaptor subunit [Gemmatimonadaceae bacterium]|nr:efflux RND transporter periplasmic adaptor subunit [Gemmatimonadaceae bacterium]